MKLDERIDPATRGIARITLEGQMTVDLIEKMIALINIAFQSGIVYQMEKELAHAATRTQDA